MTNSTANASIVLSDQASSGSLQISTIDDLGRISKMMAGSGFFSDCRDAAQAGVKILAGLELGFPAFASLTGIHIINGKPVMSANLMAAAIKRSGRYNYRAIELTDQVCELEIFEKFNGSWEPVGRSRFTIDDAKTANLSTGKNADTWRKFTKNMLFARAVSNAVRWYAADIFLGAPVYTPDEMGLPINSEGEAIDVSVVATVEPENPPPKKNKKQPSLGMQLAAEAKAAGWGEDNLKRMMMSEMRLETFRDFDPSLAEEFRTLIRDEELKSAYLDLGEFCGDQRGAG